MLSPFVLTEQKGKTGAGISQHLTRLENEESVKRGVPRLPLIQQPFSASHTWGPGGGAHGQKLTWPLPYRASSLVGGSAVIKKPYNYIVRLEPPGKSQRK